MTGSRHRRSEGSGEPAGLPSWAQRHLDEAGAADGPAATTTHRRRPAARPARSGRPAADSPLRGWGLAVLSVAAAVTAVPLAITAVANDRSGDPLPTVDTFTAGAPGPLQGGQSDAGGRGGPSSDRRGTIEVGDPSTGGVFGVPGAPAAAPAPVVVPVPAPAAVVRPTTPPAPATITPRAATPTGTTGTTATTKPTTTTTDEGKSATKPTGTTKKPTSGSKPSTSGGNGGSGGSGGSGQKGLVPQVVDTAGDTVNGLGKAVGGLL